MRGSSRSRKRVAEHVGGVDDDGQAQARRQRQPGPLEHEGAAGARQHAAPGRRRRRHAEAEKRQARLGEDHGADAGREQHDDRRHDVGQDVPPQDAPGRGADRLGGVHVHVLAHRDHGGADDARAGDAEQQAERADDLRQAGAEHGNHDQQDDEVGKAHPGIDETLRDQVDLAAEIAGEDADHDGDDRGQRRGGEGDDHRDLRAVEAAREHVAAEIVGAERIGP